MHPDETIISALNTILRDELTAINQYFLHAKLLKHKGYTALADAEYKQSLDQMRHADQLIERILEAGAQPDMQSLGEVFIGADLEEIIACDLKLEEHTQQQVESVISLCNNSGDHTSVNLLTFIRKSNEKHSNFLRKQLELLNTNSMDTEKQILMV